MATQVRAGVVLRRGADKLTAGELKWLMDNEGEVERVIKEIDERRVLYQETVLAAQAGVKAAEAAEKSLAESQAAFAEGEAASEVASAERTRKHQADMDALGRRTREVADKERAAQERAEAMDARENEREGYYRTRETELSAREEEVEAREAAMEDREQKLHDLEAGTTARVTHNKTIVSQMNHLAAGLR